MGRIIRFLDKLRVRLYVPKLTIKVISGASLILIVVMGFFTYYDMVTRTKFYIDKQEKRALEISDTVMRSIEYPMLGGDMMHVQAILKRLNTLKDVIVLNLCDARGKIKYSGLPANIGTVDTSEVTREALETNSMVKGFESFEVSAGEKVLYHAMPISNEKSCHKCHAARHKMLGILAVGIDWTPTERRVEMLRNRDITLTVVSLAVMGFFLTLFLSRYITRPLSTLTRLADGVSRGKPEFEFGRTVKCWEIEKCNETNCPAYGNTEINCWYIEGTLCYAQPSGKFPEKQDECSKCAVYKRHVGDEMVQLADSFKHMLYRLKASQEEVRQSEEKYRILFDTDPNPIFILDRETLKILDANARAESHYGYSKGDLMKMSFIDLGYEEDAREILLDFKDVSDYRCILFSKRQHRKKNGDLFYTNIHVCGARYIGRNALIATTTDVTESVRKESQLIQAGKLATLGEMAAGIAHELNQPLNVMKIGSDFLRDMAKNGKKMSDEELDTVTQEISGQVDRASGIINHMREFARVADTKAGKMDINKPIRDVFKMLGEQLRLHEIKLDLDLDENLPLIMGDSNRLEQVFINLVTNARDAMEDKRPGSTKLLKIRSFVDNEDVMVTVLDTGVGIPKNVINRIFEPFFTTKEAPRGIGLGLSISYGIVKDYGGTISVKSEVSTGTTFELRFPAFSEDA
jgi:two-component system NtrC family sensor kinase